MDNLSMSDLDLQTASLEMCQVAAWNCLAEGKIAARKGDAVAGTTVSSQFSKVVLELNSRGTEDAKKLAAELCVCAARRKHQHPLLRDTARLLLDNNIG